MKDLSEISREEYNEKEFIYKLEDLKQNFDNVEILSEEYFIVAYNNSDCWYDFYFFEWNSTSDEGQYFKEYAKVSGPSDNLRECRHTYFQNEGYIFYLEKKKMLLFIEFLERYYDLN